jgi:hypothetical protein
VLRDFARSLQTADLALATRRGYAADLGRFRAWIEKGRGEAVRLRRITTVDLASYRQYLIRSEKLRAARVNRKVQALKKFFGWAQHKQLIPANPAASLRFSATSSGRGPRVCAKKKSRRCCGRRARPATGWHAAITPFSNCCCKPACAWGRLHGWGSPIAKSTIGRGWCACAPAKAVRNARCP